MPELRVFALQLVNRDRTINNLLPLVEKAQRGWMYSNGHRANLLTTKYTRFSYSIAVGAGGQTYAVQLFAVPEPTY